MKEFQIPRCPECAQAHQEVDAYEKKRDEKASCLTIIGLIVGYEKFLLYLKAGRLGTKPPIYFKNFPAVKPFIKSGWKDRRGKAKLNAGDPAKTDREGELHDTADLQIKLAGLQINQVSLNSGKCPICNQTLSFDETAKTIDIYSYLLSSSGYDSGNTRVTWSKYREFEVHSFEICKKCNERENTGRRIKKWLGWSAIILFCIAMFLGFTYDIYLYPLLYLMIIVLILRSLTFIKFGPIPIEKKLVKIAVMHRKQTHPDAGGCTANELKELIKRNKLTNP